MFAQVAFKSHNSNSYRLNVKSFIGIGLAMNIKSNKII